MIPKIVCINEVLTEIEKLAKHLHEIGVETDKQTLERMKAFVDDKTLSRLRFCFWDQQIECFVEDGCGAMYFARHKNENMVALAIWIAINYRLFCQRNHEGNTILHYAANYLSPAMCRLILTRGGDGCIPNAWGR
jgi:hypothetical protein